jgi:transcriptional regulator with XRE-family HTH domain
MSINIGPIIRRRREWARLTQQELVDHTRMDRSSSYISAIENGKTSPTLDEAERLARYFRLTLIDLLQEASDGAEKRGEPGGDAEPDEQLTRLYGALSPDDQELALEFIELLAKRRRR